MSPSQLHSNKDVQSYWASPLKINKASHNIKKPSSSPSSSSSSSTLAIVLPPPPPPQPLPQQCNPVIIYTHSPKVITTNQRDFMTLVQKLTGISSSKDDDDDDDDTNPPWTQPETGDASSPPLSEINKGSKTAATGNDDNESSSVTTEENGSCSNVGDHIGQVINSCFVPRPNPCNLMNKIPVFTSNSADIFCPNLPFLSCNDSFLFAGASRRTPVRSKSSTVIDGKSERVP